MNLPKKIFSIENENLHKVFIIFGFKIKIFDRILAMKKDIDFLQKENTYPLSCKERGYGIRRLASPFCRGVDLRTDEE